MPPDMFGADVNAELDEFLLVAVEDLERQAEGRDAVAHHAAELALALEDRHIVAELGGARRLANDARWPARR